MRYAVAQGLARPVVEQVDGVSDFKLADFQEVDLLGNVLAQQAIVVLIEPMLSGAVRVCNVHLGAQALGHGFIQLKSATDLLGRQKQA